MTAVDHLLAAARLIEEASEHMLKAGRIAGRFWAPEFLQAHKTWWTKATVVRTWAGQMKT